MLTEGLLENIEWIGTCIAIITSIIAVVQTKKANRIANEVKNLSMKPILICDGNVDITNEIDEMEYTAYKQYTFQDEFVKVGFKNIGETIITSVMIVDCKVNANTELKIGDEVNHSGVQEYWGIKHFLHKFWTHWKNRYKHIQWNGDEYHIVICPQEVNTVLVGIANKKEFSHTYTYKRTIWELFFRIIIEVPSGNRYAEELLVKIKEYDKDKYKVIGNRVKINFIK